LILPQMKHGLNRDKSRFILNRCFIRVSSVALLFCLFTFTGAAQPGSDDTNALKLLPPYGELPPTFWERYGPAILVIAFIVLVVAALVLWLVLKPRRQASLPPAVQAQRALEALRGRLEDGACLSSVSLILRHYFVSAFNLSINESTTGEFRQAISNDQQIGSELAAVMTEFLRECDERKFSLGTPTAPVGAVDRALRLVAQAEARRAQPGSAVVSTASSDDSATRRQDGGAPRV
jgi:hypothetical protein